MMGIHQQQKDLFSYGVDLDKRVRKDLSPNQIGTIEFPINKPGEMSDAVVETVDVFPTLIDLAKLPSPNQLSGVSITPLLDALKSSGRPALGYDKKNLQTIRTETHRLIAHEDGDLELYNHRTAEGETKNLAEAQPELTQNLLAQIKARFE